MNVLMIKHLFNEICSPNCNVGIRTGCGHDIFKDNFHVSMNVLIVC